MTTRQIIERDEEGKDICEPGFAFRGKGYIMCSRRGLRRLCRTLLDDLAPSTASFEDQEALAKLRGRVI